MIQINSSKGRECAPSDEIRYARSLSVLRGIMPSHVSPSRLSTKSSSIRDHPRFLQSRELTPPFTRLPYFTRSLAANSSVPFETPLLRSTISPTRVPSSISIFAMEQSTIQSTPRATLTAPLSIGLSATPQTPRLSHATMAAPRASIVYSCPPTPHLVSATVVAPCGSDLAPISTTPSIACSTLVAAPGSVIPPLSLPNPRFVSNLTSFPPTPRLSNAALHTPHLRSSTTGGDQLRGKMENERTTSHFFATTTTTTETTTIENRSRRRAQR